MEYDLKVAFDTLSGGLGVFALLLLVDGELDLCARLCEGAMQRVLFGADSDLKIKFKLI